MTLAFRIYRRLARAFPHEFKVAYGAEVMLVGEDAIRDIAKRHGAAGLFPLLADIAIRIPAEYLSEMRSDIRYALRGLRKSPGFALVGIISLGIGMGLTTEFYSSRWQWLTRNLPAAANAPRVVMAEKPVSYYYVEQYREQKKLFAGVAALETGIPFNVTFGNDGSAKPERIFGQLVSPDYFSVLGVEAQRGRVLNPALDTPGDAPVVVISDRFWRTRLNASPDAIGQTVRLNGQPATIVGIASKNFNGVLPLNPSELFVPITAPAAVAPELANDVLHQRRAKDFIALICLAPGVTVDSAEGALDSITRHLDEQDPQIHDQADKSRRVTLLSAGGMVPLPRRLKPVIVGFFFVLMGLIMTIACMNLANMLLARGANRRKELGIRLAIGASRFRLIRQMMSEGIVLSLLGGIAGFGLAYGIAVLNSQFVLPAAVPVETNFRPDAHAAVFVFVLAFLCGMGFSVAPALRATRSDVISSLKGTDSVQLPGYGRFGLRNLLMVAQVAGSLMLVLMTGFLVLGFGQVSRIQTKFDAHSMYLLSLDPVRDGYSPEKAQALFEKLPDTLKAIPGVRRVALTAQVPFEVDADEDDRVPVTAERTGGSSRVQINAMEGTVGAGYFAALSEPILSGREFTEADQRIQPDDPKALPVIVNEKAADGLFHKGNAIGERLRDEKRSYEVVGVVPDILNGSGLDWPQIYLTLTPRDFARPPAGGITIMVRSDSENDPLDAMRREIAGIDPTLNLFDVRTLNAYLDESRVYQSFSIDTYGAIGIFGLGWQPSAWQA